MKKKLMILTTLFAVSMMTVAVAQQAGGSEKPMKKAQKECCNAPCDKKGKTECSKDKKGCPNGTAKGMEKGSKAEGGKKM